VSSIQSPIKGTLVFSSTPQHTSGSAQDLQAPSIFLLHSGHSQKLFAIRFQGVGHILQRISAQEGVSAFGTLNVGCFGVNGCN